ncbi:hypothetical protein KP79_PYT00313 [Mizuhopecten yessoensis]|uniref:Uncharacterized protein n=1 Tax=Mizuhopecten yessoensis TaxID=6573 RepID=A0A210R1F8_MIZYE|nr:hypothetical protein KP79_PYT00313 [Mizuhopecten yessoensis]
MLFTFGAVTGVARNSRIKHSGKLPGMDELAVTATTRMDMDILQITVKLQEVEEVNDGLRSTWRAWHALWPSVGFRSITDFTP